MLAPRLELMALPIAIIGIAAAEVTGSGRIKSAAPIVVNFLPGSLGCFVTCFTIATDSERSGGRTLKEINVVACPISSAFFLADATLSDKTDRCDCNRAVNFACQVLFAIGVKIHRCLLFAISQATTPAATPPSIFTTLIPSEQA